MLWLKKTSKKVLTRGWRLALMGGLFKFKPRLGIWKSSLTAWKYFFEKNKFFWKKALTTEGEFALMGGLFKFKRTTFETLGRGAEFRRRSSEKKQVLWNLLSTIVRTCQKFFWQKTLNKKKSNESIRNWYRRWTLQEILKKRFYGEFDSGSEWTLAAWLRHASRARTKA